MPYSSATRGRMYFRHRTGPMISPRCCPQSSPNHPVNVISKRPADELQVERQDAVEQLVGESGVVDHRHEHVLHPGEGPRPLEHGEGKRGDDKPVSPFLQCGGKVREPPRVPRVGEPGNVPASPGSPPYCTPSRCPHPASCPIGRRTHPPGLPDPFDIAVRNAGAQDRQAVAQPRLEIRVPVVPRQRVRAGTVNVTWKGTASGRRCSTAARTRSRGVTPSPRRR